VSAHPRVSVVISTCNREARLREAVASVLAQSFRDLEIIVCDDGSSDETAATAQSFGAPVRYLRLDHTGRPAMPRNLGIEAARGELVAFLDDDDLWESNKLFAQIALVDRDPGLGFIYTDRRLLRERGPDNIVAVTPSPSPSGDFIDVLLAGQFPHICSVLIRRDLLLRTGGFDTTLDYAGEELDLWFRLARVTRAARVPEPLVLIRRVVPGRRHPSGPLDHAITAFERQLKAGDLSLAQRLRCHAMLSRLNRNLAAKLTADGDRHRGRRAALRALRHCPLSPRAWATALSAALPRA
jgi:glycosyltransferase involved in cell wall biosynthesis